MNSHHLVPDVPYRGYDDAEHELYFGTIDALERLPHRGRAQGRTGAPREIRRNGGEEMTAQECAVSGARSSTRTPAPTFACTSALLATVQAAGAAGVTRSELSRPTRLPATRLERALTLLASRALNSVVLEPSDGRPAVRYRALTEATARRAA
jgi:hypothetical protein